MQLALRLGDLVPAACAVSIPGEKNSSQKGRMLVTCNLYLSLKAQTCPLL